MTARWLCIAAMTVLSCSSEPDGDPAKIATFEYRVPSSWSSHDVSNAERAAVEWTPAPNERKEAISVLVSERRPADAKAGVGHVQRLLEASQQALHGKFSAAVPFTTKHGLHGVRIEGEFVPVGQTEPYRRMHAVLIDGTVLLHVLYTAKRADRAGFDLVVDSFQRGV